jgi:DNA-binding XRE family transcriptional regulator
MKEPSNVYVELGKKLRARRQEFGISTYALGQKIGCASPRVVEHEKGRVGMSVETLMKYCEALDLTFLLVPKKK